jgi:site-specific DNA recombinase
VRKVSAQEKIDETAKIVVRVIIYARVSSVQQLENKEEDSIRSQIKHCKRFAKAAKQANEIWEIITIITDDGRTGRNDNRAGIQQVRELVRAGGVDIVLVNRLSRAFRNTRLAMEFDEFLQKHGARLVSRMEPNGTDTASDKIARRINYVFDEGRSDSISEDVIRSIESRAEKGLTHGGVPTPGYDAKDGRLIINEKDAEVVREIFNMVVSGMTPMEVVKDLNIRKIRTRQRVSKKGNTTGGKRFRIEHLLPILQNPLYKGWLIYNGIGNASAAPAIVSEETWEKAQVALDQRPRKKEGITQERDKNFLPLKGKIRCGCCSSAMKPSFSTKRKSDGSMEKYFYYLCSKHEKQGNESSCTIRRVPARLIESLLMAAFGEIAANPEVAKQLIDKVPKAKTTKIRELAKERQAIRKQLKELDVEVEKVTQKFLNTAGTAMGDKLEKINNELTNQKTDLVTEEIKFNKEIDALKSDLLAPHKLQHALAHFADAVKCLSETEQRELYKLLFKSIIVNEGGKAKDPIAENSPRTREARRQLSVEVRLRTEAIQTLIGDPKLTGARKKGFTIPLEIAHCRKKPMENCALLSPVHKECGHKAPKTRKRPKKTEHEIHRALRWKQEMEELGINESKFAKKLKISRNAVNEVMKWLKLDKPTQTLLVNLKDSGDIRKYSRKWRKGMLPDQRSKVSTTLKQIELLYPQKDNMKAQKSNRRPSD